MVVSEFLEILQVNSDLNVFGVFCYGIISSEYFFHTYKAHWLL